jgi:hypothetical protein
MSGYPIAAEALDLEIYVLAALFAGSETLANSHALRPGLSWVRATFEHSEVSRRLLSLAVMLRGQLDTASRPIDAPVGSLVPDLGQPLQCVPLTLREACNKIIHAELVDLAPGKWEHSEVPALSNTIILGGTFHGTEWRASLDVAAFLELASAWPRPA